MAANCTFGPIEYDFEYESAFILLEIFLFFLVECLVAAIFLMLFFLYLVYCVKPNYCGAIDENKNLDVAIYIRNHREGVRRQKACGLLQADYPSWPDGVVLPYRPWDNENQVPIY